jgi:hypothetical protein
MAAFAKGKSYVILVNMANKNPEAKKLLNDLKNISQEEFDSRFSQLLGNKAGATPKEPEQPKLAGAALDDEVSEDDVNKHIETIRKKGTSSPLAGIKPIAPEVSATQPEQPKPIEKAKPSNTMLKDANKITSRIAQLQNTVPKDLGYTYYEQYENDEINNFIDNEFDAIADRIIKKDEAKMMKAAQEFYSKYEDVSGQGDGSTTRNQFLEQYMANDYKPAKIISREEFYKAKGNKPMLYRGVDNKDVMAKTYNSNEPWYMRSGAKGDGIYLTDNVSIAKDYGGSGETANVMAFIPNDNFKTVNRHLLDKMGNKFSKKLNELSELYQRQKNYEAAENIDNTIQLLDATNYTILARALGFDAVEVDFIDTKLEGNKGSNRNYVFLSFDNLITYDATKEGSPEGV